MDGNKLKRTLKFNSEWSVTELRMKQVQKTCYNLAKSQNGIVLITITASHIFLTLYTWLKFLIIDVTKNN